MADIQERRVLSKDFRKLELTDDLKYHYSPVPSNCMACAARKTSRKYEELKLPSQRSEATLYAPFPSSEDVCRFSGLIAKENYYKTKLHVVTTNQRIKVFGKWSEQKLLKVVMDRLLQRATNAVPCNSEKVVGLGFRPGFPGIPYDPIIHRGIYSESILRKLYFTGATELVLITAMKFGLRHLAPDDLNHFTQFGVSTPVLSSQKLWKESIDESLMLSLRTMGFDDKSSRKIILTGILAQNQTTLMQLMLAGVDIPSILNWHGTPIDVGPRHVQFLRKLGVLEDVLQLVVQRGIDEETNEMLKDLGFSETEEEDHHGMHEVVICECNLTILESQSAPQDVGNESLSNVVPKFDDSNGCIGVEETCACSTSANSSTLSTPSNLVSCTELKSPQSSVISSELLAERNNYLRRTVMVPLSWAMAKALQYRPSDPKYYIACQLIRWRYGGVSGSEMKKVEDFMVARTISMDKLLAEEKTRKEKELLAKQEMEVFKNIPCYPCWDRLSIHRVKERCWKCVTKWVPNYEPCEFQETCSSCNVNLSHILNSDSSLTSGAAISVGSNSLEDGKGTVEDPKSLIFIHKNSCTQEMASSNFQRDYNSYKGSLGSDYSAECGGGVVSESVESRSSPT